MNVYNKDVSIANLLITNAKLNSKIGIRAIIVKGNKKLFNCWVTALS